MANFNELLLEMFKEISARLKRVEDRVDHIINEKADKADVKSALEKLDQKTDKADVQSLKVEVKTDIQDLKVEVKTDIQDLKADIKDVRGDIKDILDQKADKADVNELRDEVRTHGQRLDRIETGIKTLQWTMTAGLAVLGIILAFMRAC